MTPATEIESLTEEVQRWRRRCLIGLAVVLLIAVLVLMGGVSNEGVVACGVACGAGRMKMVKRGVCECSETGK